MVCRTERDPRRPGVVKGSFHDLQPNKKQKRELLEELLTELYFFIKRYLFELFRAGGAKVFCFDLVFHFRAQVPGVDRPFVCGHGWAFCAAMRAGATNPFSAAVYVFVFSYPSFDRMFLAEWAR